MSKVIIVGAGQAGGRVATGLRSKGYQGEVILLGEEPHPPYKRPPLSKTVLQGKAEVQDGYLIPVADYADKGIELHLNRNVGRLDIKDQRVYLDDGESLVYDDLVLATGGTPRTLPLAGSELENVFLLRTAQDSEGIRGCLGPGVRAAVIGGGFIGLEVAASARTLGCEVTVLEAQPHLLGRSLPPQMADAVAQVHSQEGVTVVTGAKVKGFAGNGAVQTVVMTEGEDIPVDVVVIGVGIVPRTSLAEAASLECDDGIVVDQRGRTSADHVYAAGDCAKPYLPRYGRHIRLESFQNADQQGANVASAIMGEECAYDPVPFVWSDQYKRILQTAGFPGMGTHHVTRGSVGDENLVLFSLLEDRLIGVAGWGRGQLIAKDVRFSQMLMEKGKSASASQLENPDISIKDLLTA